MFPERDYNASRAWPCKVTPAGSTRGVSPLVWVTECGARGLGYRDSVQSTGSGSPNSVPRTGLEAGVRSRTGSYVRRIDSGITQLKAQGPSRTCNESKEEEKGGVDQVCVAGSRPRVSDPWGWCGLQNISMEMFWCFTCTFNLERNVLMTSVWPLNLNNRPFPTHRLQWCCGGALPTVPFSF